MGPSIEDLTCSIAVVMPSILSEIEIELFELKWIFLFGNVDEKRMFAFTSSVH